MSGGLDIRPAAAPPGHGMALHRVAAIALACLGVSAVILVVGWLVYASIALVGAAAEPLALDGGSLKLQAGLGNRAPDGLAVRALSGTGEAVVSSGSISVNTADYPLLTYDIEGLSPATGAYLFWRTEDSPMDYRTVPLPPLGDGARTLRLEGLEFWKDRVFEIMGGTNGCTHLIELLGTMVTVAYQTVSSSEKYIEMIDSAEFRPFFINSCHAYDESGPVIEKLYPRFFKPRK